MRERGPLGARKGSVEVDRRGDGGKNNLNAQERERQRGRDSCLNWPL